MFKVATKRVTRMLILTQVKITSGANLQVPMANNYGVHEKVNGKINNHMLCGIREVKVLLGPVSKNRSWKQFFRTQKTLFCCFLKIVLSSLETCLLYFFEFLKTKKHKKPNGFFCFFAFDNRKWFSKTRAKQPLILPSSNGWISQVSTYIWCQIKK